MLLIELTVQFFGFFLEKMSCLNFLQVNNDPFHLKTRFFKSRQPLVVFSLNTVLNSKELFKGYCFCKNTDAVCLVCQFKICYLNNEYDLYENCLNWDFLSGFHKRMCEHLKKLVTLDNHVVCKLLNNKFYYIHKDWFTGEKEAFDLEDCLDFHENKKIEQIKNNEFKVVVLRL